MCLNMKNISVILLILCLSQVWAGQKSTVKGELSWNDNHFAVVRECNTGKKYTLGVMASTQYIKLQRRAEELSKKSKILITVQGTISNKRSLTIKYPVVRKLKLGGCDDKAT